MMMMLRERTKVQWHGTVRYVVASADRGGTGREFSLAEIHGVDAVELGDTELVGEFVGDVGANLPEDTSSLRRDRRREKGRGRGDDGADRPATARCVRWGLSGDNLSDGLLAQSRGVQGEEVVVLHKPLLVPCEQGQQREYEGQRGEDNRDRNENLHGEADGEAGTGRNSTGEQKIMQYSRVMEKEKKQKK